MEIQDHSFHRSRIRRSKVPTKSRIDFSPRPEFERQRHLSVGEVARLSLDADLVTLSSCDTGIGKTEGEEGITGLVPAFVFAGARSVVGSLWPIDDSATETEMTHFYSHIAQGEDPATALRDAKLDYMRLEGGQPPVFWAGFILEGDGSQAIKF